MNLLASCSLYVLIGCAVGAIFSRRDEGISLLLIFFWPLVIGIIFIFAIMGICIGVADSFGKWLDEEDDFK